MEKSHIYFRALADYRKNTKEQKECARSRKNIISANPESDVIEVVKTNCNICDDWIESIEKGLVFVEKAIREERQFITTNGEVVPIEKVKHVSKDSVEHLARHSNLLTKVTEGEDIIPDKLYTVERLSDYAVYENRFLYMLLCYLKEFIAYRYDKIVGLTNTYNGKFVVKKTIESRSGKSVCDINFSEERKNDEYLTAHNPVKDKLERIDLLYKTVMMLLSTPLMDLVAKAPMLKPPITETNVLKMNRNFKGAMELYYFITAYEGDGFTIERETKTLSPFEGECADECAEVVELTSFLTHEYGLDIQQQLQADYLLEQEERARTAENERKERMERLRKRIAQTGKSDEEYMLFLEERNKQLENVGTLLESAQAQIEEMTKTERALNEKITTLCEQVDDGRKQLLSAEAEYKSKLNKTTSEYEGTIAKLNQEHLQKIETLTSQAEERISTLRSQDDEKLKEVLDEHEREKATLLQELENTKLKFDESEKERLLLGAQLNALKQQYGLFKEGEEFTSESDFNQLERQYEAFKQLFEEQWKATKKRIRREVIFAKKGKKDKQEKLSLPNDSDENTNKKDSDGDDNL